MQAPLHNAIEKKHSSHEQSGTVFLPNGIVQWCLHYCIVPHTRDSEKTENVRYSGIRQSRTVGVDTDCSENI